MSEERWYVYPIRDDDGTDEDGRTIYLTRFELMKNYGKCTEKEALEALGCKTAQDVASKFHLSSPYYDSIIWVKFEYDEITKTAKVTEVKQK